MNLVFSPPRDINLSSTCQLLLGQHDSTQGFAGDSSGDFLEQAQLTWQDQLW